MPPVWSINPVSASSGTGRNLCLVSSRQVLSDRDREEISVFRPSIRFDKSHLARNYSWISLHTLFRFPVSAPIRVSLIALSIAYNRYYQLPIVCASDIPLSFWSISQRTVVGMSTIAAALPFAAGRELHTVFLLLTLLGPQSRFGDKLRVIRVLCPHIWECGAKGVKHLHIGLLRTVLLHRTALLMPDESSPLEVLS